MNPIRCVVFDFDGTLIDSNRLKRDAWFKVFSGLDCSTEFIEGHLSQHPLADRTELIDLMLAQQRDRLGLRGNGNVAALSQRLTDHYNDICEERQSTCAAMPGALSTLTRLQSVFPLYLNSATPETPLRRIVERRGWTLFFHGIHGRPRSKIEILQTIASAEGISAPQVAMVGDGQADLEASRAFGCTFFAVGELSSVSYGRRLTALTELPDILSSSN